MQLLKLNLHFPFGCSLLRMTRMPKRGGDPGQGLAMIDLTSAQELELCGDRQSSVDSYPGKRLRNQSCHHRYAGVARIDRKDRTYLQDDGFGAGFRA